MKTHKRKELKSAEILVFVILLVCHVFPLQANVAVVRNLDNGSGLQDPQVNCITKDSKGFIWFGTLNTIQRFDGVRFIKDYGNMKPNPKSFFVYFPR